MGAVGQTDQLSEKQKNPRGKKFGRFFFGIAGGCIAFALAFHQVFHSVTKSFADQRNDAYLQDPKNMKMHAANARAYQARKAIEDAEREEQRKKLEEERKLAEEMDDDFEK